MILYRLSNWFKNSDLFQGILLLLIVFTSMGYSYLLLSDFSNYNRVIKNNENEVIKDTTLVDVLEYSINTDGSIEMKLSDGTEYSTENCEIVFINQTSDDRCYFSKESSVLICEISDDYELNFLLGSKYFMVLLFSFLWLILVYLLRSKNYSLLSKEYVLWFVIFAFILISFSGVLIITNFSVLSFLS